MSVHIQRCEGEEAQAEDLAEVGEGSLGERH